MFNIDNNLSSYQAKFIAFLKSEKYSISSVKSFETDVLHYFNWVVVKIQRSKSRLSTRNKLMTYFNYRALQQYLDEQITNASVQIVKRRILSLSNFLNFSVKQKWLEDKLLVLFRNLADSYQQSLNRSNQWLVDFKLYLQDQKVSKNTIRGYLSDINEFLITN